jgi:hypothetical protein
MQVTFSHLISCSNKFEHLNVHSGPKKLQHGSSKKWAGPQGKKSNNRGDQVSFCFKHAEFFWATL